MSCIIRELDKVSDHKIVHTGQNYDYELNEIFFDELDLRPVDFYLGSSDISLFKTIANIFVNIEELFNKNRPDAIVIYGDTNSCLAAYVAKRMHIPVFHLEAGNRCYDFRVPEETNRKIVDHLSDVNFVLSQEAKESLISEGFPKNRIFNVGSNIPEVFGSVEEKVCQSKILEKLGINSDYYLVSIHREENVDNDEILKNIVRNINDLAKETKTKVIWSAHPRLVKKLANANIQIDENYLFMNKPFGFIDFLKLQKNAKCLISDSGTVSEEVSILKIPAVTIRNAHERPEGMQEGVFIMSSKGNKLKSSVDYVIGESSRNNIGEPYPNVHNSGKITKIILSYIDYINAEIWKK